MSVWQSSLACDGLFFHSAGKEMTSLGRAERNWGPVEQAKGVLDRENSVGRMALMLPGYDECQKDFLSCRQVLIGTTYSHVKNLTC